MKIYLAGLYDKKDFEGLKNKKGVEKIEHQLGSYFYIRTNIEKIKESVDFYLGDKEE